MNDTISPALQWLLEQQIAEQRAVRASEDSLFNLTITLYVAALGGLTGIRATEHSWSPTWRLLVMLAIGIIASAILLMALLLRNRQEELQQNINRTAAQILPGSPILQTTDNAMFYIRWGAVTFLAVITVVLIWLLS